MGRKYNVESKFCALEVVDGKVSCLDIEELATDQEEADTKVFLCCFHASSHGFSSVCILTVDSDIPIYALYFEDKIDVHIFVKIGVGIRKRTLDIKDIALELGRQCCSALPSRHAFIGNDYTSGFHGLGKLKAYKLLKSSEKFQDVFSNFGESFTFDASLFPSLETFVCRLYGHQCDNINDARYQKFCSKKKSPEPQQLPPTRDALLCHAKRTSYATAVIKRSLQRFPEVPSPNGYGWKLQNGELSIVWMLRKPAPDEILELINCNCRKSKCSTQACLCKTHGLKCTDLCGCGICENADNENDDCEQSDDDSDGSFASDSDSSAEMETTN